MVGGQRGFSMSLRGWLGASVFVAVALLGPAAPPSPPPDPNEHSIVWFSGNTAAPQLRFEVPPQRAPQQPAGEVAAVAYARERPVTGEPSHVVPAVLVAVIGAALALLGYWLHHRPASR
jgi:hypothetical protein